MPAPTMAAGSWPILANLFMQRGNHAWGQEQWDTAGTSYRLAVAYAPQQAPAHRRLAEVLLYHQQQPGAALAQLEVAVALDPADGYGYILKARACGPERPAASAGRGPAGGDGRQHRLRLPGPG
ncbi:MAG: hypothetical protein HZY76_21375 [Anaerolineae bacterium]|nr:MAG: hypothetical protein HZY76_21375 [Anaerolineae bacterium]